MTVQELFEEIDCHLMNDTKPSIYLNGQYWNPLFRKFPFGMLYRLKEVQQSPKFHPEGNVWIHTMMVVDEAAKLRKKSREPKVLMWSALLHDIGKAEATKRKNGRITSVNHEAIGEKLARDFLSCFGKNKEFVEKVCGMVRYHMQILFVTADMPYADVKGMKERVNVYELAALGLSDRLGRGRTDRKKEEETIELFLEKCGVEP